MSVQRAVIRTVLEAIGCPRMIAPRSGSGVREPMRGSQQLLPDYNLFGKAKARSLGVPGEWILDMAANERVAT